MISLQSEGPQEGHFLILVAAGPVSAPAPATLQITNGRQGRADVCVAKGKAFQLTAEEARASPHVVTGMYLLLISLFILNCLLMFICFILGLFLVNDISALVLFNSGAT